MKDLSTKKDNANKAISALKKALARDWQNDEELRDAVIQRFEFSLETTWKLFKAHYENEGIKLDTPKAVFRQLHASNLINYEETEFALKMVDDRNLSSHTYNEALAIEIANKIPEYYQFLSRIYNLIN